MNRRGVSAVIGVILMVAITVAIAATVFVYVQGLRDKQAEEVYFEGWVVDAYDKHVTISVDEQNYSLWQISLGSKHNSKIEDADTYSMVFTHNMSPPPEGVHLRLYYEVITDDELGTLFNVYKVKSL